MIRNVVKICFLLTVILISSCEEDFILDRSNYKPKIVVNSIFKPGEDWVVNLSSSRDFLVKDSEIRNIENATVTVIEKSNGRELRLNHVGNGKYVSKIYPPVADKTYELIVESDGFETVNASSKAPNKANVINVISDVVDQKTTKVNFEVKGNTNNYLIWNFINSNPKNPIDSTFTGNPKSLVTGIIKYNNISNYLGGLTESTNNAITQEGSFSAEVRNEDNTEEGSTPNNPNPNGNSKRYLRILTASVDLYNYYQTVEKFIAADNHNSSFSHSPQIYSNIKNGLGIFAGYTEEFKEIK